MTASEAPAAAGDAAVKTVLGEDARGAQGVSPGPATKSLYGAKLKQGSAGFGKLVHLPGFHFGYLF